MEKVFDCVVIGAGQAGLATAYHLQKQQLEYLVLEASDQTAGSWPSYYDSLTLFSPARYSSLPEFRFPGDPDHYPTKQEVVSYLTEYATHFQFPIRTNERVIEIKQDHLFQIHTSLGNIFHAKTVVSATGAFAYPYIPDLNGIHLYQGTMIHSSQYQKPESFQGQRIVVVGAGNSAVQIAFELSTMSNVSLATRSPISFMPQRVLGKDVHFWLKITGIDWLPLKKWLSMTNGVLDTGIYEKAISKNKPDRRSMFTSFTENGVLWESGKEEKIDTIIFATGYRPNVSHLKSLNTAIDSMGNPIQNNGVSSTVRGLYYVGLEWQRSFSSATLRGVGTDAKYIVKHIRQFI
ncbi:flavin-containing monooxygenase [Risungbinella massiliensis]|uniref:flavin-containing monooxygenase n=1 Tax=Risungbinella massiliensis TaxID=1329796 RepID=UPI0005CBF1D2|nr:NAD(P)/FAD-dependent oxidoreductase [Risungbinella massiliensis]